MTYTQRQKWFTDRVGKTLYRQKDDSVLPVKVLNFNHAIFLHDLECSYMIGHVYFESKAYVKTLIL